MPSPVLPPPPDGLRHWRRQDAPALVAAWQDPTIVADRAALDRSTLDRAAAVHWIDGVERRWHDRSALDLVITSAVVDEDTGDPGVIGEVGLANFTDEPPRAELGVWVVAERRRQGVAGRAVRRVTVWAFEELGLVQLWARTSARDRRAAALFTSLGWRRLGGTGGDARTVAWAATEALLR